MYYLIHQQSGSTREVKNLQFLRQIANECFQSDYRIIITDNSVSSPVRDAQFLKLPTDNEFREFSGWSSGIQFLEKEIGVENLSGVLLTNETLLKHRPFDRAKKQGMVDAIKYSQTAEFPVMAGDIDLIRTQGPYHYPSIDSFYISTYFCFINRASIPLLNIFHLDCNLKKILNPTPNSESVVLDDARTRAPNHYQFIEEWLYRMHPGPKWYAHEKLSNKNYSKMAIKFLSIIIEHGISQKFVAEGGILIDYKSFINRNFFERFCFYLKRIRYSLGWRLNRIIKL